MKGNLSLKHLYFGKTTVHVHVPMSDMITRLDVMIHSDSKHSLNGVWWREVLDFAFLSHLKV